MMVLGGSSLATTSFVRRRMSGETLRLSEFWMSELPSFSMGLLKVVLNALYDCRSPGMRKLNVLHSSPRWFSMGVPERQMR